MSDYVLLTEWTADNLINKCNQLPNNGLDADYIEYKNFNTSNKILLNNQALLYQNLLFPKFTFNTEIPSLPFWYIINNITSQFIKNTLEPQYGSDFSFLITYKYLSVINTSNFYYLYGIDGDASNNNYYIFPCLLKIPKKSFFNYRPNFPPLDINLIVLTNLSDFDFSYATGNDNFIFFGRVGEIIAGRNLANPLVRFYSKGYYINISNNFDLIDYQLPFSQTDVYYFYPYFDKIIGRVYLVSNLLYHISYDVSTQSFVLLEFDISQVPFSYVIKDTNFPNSVGVFNYSDFYFLQNSKLYKYNIHTKFLTEIATIPMYYDTQILGIYGKDLIILQLGQFVSLFLVDLGSYFVKKLTIPHKLFYPYYYTVFTNFPEVLVCEMYRQFALKFNIYDRVGVL